jgi:hypothetical protein
MSKETDLDDKEAGNLGIQEAIREMRMFGWKIHR